MLICPLYYNYVSCDVVNRPPTSCRSSIAFHWESDNLGVKSLERGILNVFKSIYGLEPESFTMPLVES